MSKTAQKVAQTKIPKFMRKKFFGMYSKFYKVKLDQIVDPIQSFQTFCDFFTRRVKQRQINRTQQLILSPADSKILKISQINVDQCSIIKGATYSLGQLMTGRKQKFTQQQINNLKINKQNKLYQVILYLAPGDYHRFHSPTNFYVQTRQKIEGFLLSVSQKTLIKRKKVYQKNGRLVLNGTYKPIKNENMFMSMVMVGALNVGRIIVKQNMQFQRGSELGYFNLGSTIVMIFEAPSIKKWYKNQGDKIRYGQPMCQVNPN